MYLNQTRMMNQRSTSQRMKKNKKTTMVKITMMGLAHPRANAAHLGTARAAQVNVVKLIAR